MTNEPQGHRHDSLWPCAYVGVPLAAFRLAGLAIQRDGFHLKAYGARCLHAPHPRATATLLLEHEVEMRAHGYRSALYGVKWCGRVHKR